MHFKRMLVSSFVYFSCIFMLLYVPIRGTQEVFTRYYNSKLTLKWYTYYPAIELQLPIEVTLYYLLSIQTIDGLKGPLRFLLHSLLTKSCALLGLSAYMLPRTKIQTDGDDVRPQDQRRRQQREERRNRARQELRRRRYGFEHRTAEERLKDLRPRGPAPALAAPRILVLACMIWTSLVCLVFLLGYSSLWLGRTWCSSARISIVSLYLTLSREYHCNHSFVLQGNHSNTNV